MSTSTSAIRTRWAAVGAAVAITLGAAGIGGLNIASADVSTGDRPVYIPINPCRLVDTRPGDLTVGPKTSPLGPAEVLTVTAHGSNGECTGASTIPTDAVGLSLNVTAVGPTSNTFLTFWGEGDNPGTSNLNPRAGGDPTPNAVATPLSDVGTFNIFNNRGSVNVIVDVNGYYANHNHDDRYQLPTAASVLQSGAVCVVDPTDPCLDDLEIGAPGPHSVLLTASIGWRPTNVNGDARGGCRFSRDGDQLSATETTLGQVDVSTDSRDLSHAVLTTVLGPYTGTANYNVVCYSFVGLEYTIRDSSMTAIVIPE